MYDYLIITHLPVFYKVNLYNKLAENLNIFVIFVSSDTNEVRASDFSSLPLAKFKYEVLSEGNFQTRNKIFTCFKMLNITYRIKFKKLLLSGWDLPEFWLALFLLKNKSKCLALESTEIESNSAGIKGFIKKTFLAKITLVYASGEMHINLLNKLGYKKEIRKTLGVGIVNNNTPKQVIKHGYNKRFLFIGRLSKVKNLDSLIILFNSLKDFRLTIVGTGEDESNLHKLAGESIIFHGKVNNSELPRIFSDNDMFILPSVSEPWGLVTEEALLNRVPVIISENCGSKDLITNDVNGFIFNPYDINELKTILLNLTENKYLDLISNIDPSFIYGKDMSQVEAYLE